MIPIKVSTSGAPDDLQKINHVVKSRKAISDFTKKTSSSTKKFASVFHKIAVKQSKETGQDIARRIAKLRKLKGKK